MYYVLSKNFFEPRMSLVANWIPFSPNFWQVFRANDPQRHPTNTYCIFAEWPQCPQWPQILLCYSILKSCALRIHNGTLYYYLLYLCRVATVATDIFLYSIMKSCVLRGGHNGHSDHRYFYLHRNMQVIGLIMNPIHIVLAFVKSNEI
jgi:hypothetical protein